MWCYYFEKRRMVTKLLFISGTLLLLLVATACSSTVKTVAPPRPEVRGLKLGNVQLQATGGYEVAGIVKAAQVAVMAPQTMGRVNEVLTREGAVVQQGQVLITLTAPEAVQRTHGAEQQVAAAVAARQLADATYSRTLALFQTGAVSKQELDRSLAAKESAAAEEARAKAAVGEAAAVESYLEIRAPYKGVVTRQLAEVGMVVSPAQTIVTVEDQSRYEIEAWVDISQAGKVQRGMTVQLRRSGEEAHAQKGTVLYVSPSAATDSRSFLVKIAPELGNWRSGEFIQVRFPISSASRMTIPASAVVEKGQLTGVYVVGRDNVLSYRLLRLGRMEGERVEVLAGLNGPERIVIGDVRQAVDGGILKEESR